MMWLEDVWLGALSEKLGEWHQVELRGLPFTSTLQESEVAFFCTRGRSKIIGDIAALESASLEQDVKQFLREHAVNLAVRNSANETSRSKLTLSKLSVASFCESEQKGFRHRAQSLGLS